MSSNGYSNGPRTVLVLYKISNSEAEEGDPLFNAFPMPIRGKGPTLGSVKQSCLALRSLSHLGPDGYHWRVCVEDRADPSSAPAERTFSWWDIQDENAVLPIKEASQSDLAQFFAPPAPKVSGDSASEAAKAAKGAFKSFGKALGAVVDGAEGSPDRGPPVSVIAFKLLDLVKMHDDFERKHGESRGVQVQHTTPSPQPAARSQPPPQARPQHRPSPAAAPPQQAPRRPAPPAQPQQPAHTARAQQRAQQRPQAVASKLSPPPRNPQQDANLMDFGAPTADPRRALHHATSSPAAFKNVNPNETRAERLKREYAQKKSTANRVWDDVDQRWVEVDPKAGAVSRGTTSKPPGSDQPVKPATKSVGIKLDAANAVGKSANVQAAVNQRVNEMKQSQQKALEEVRKREQQKKKDEVEEDAVRKKLEPKIKHWSEEHGKKKQLRALLGSLHTILWPEANWKPVSIGDILDDSKCKRCFHKASRVVHPDKTHHLDPEKRFLAKRIFDALSQAKQKMDEGGQ